MQLAKLLTYDSMKRLSKETKIIWQNLVQSAVREPLSLAAIQTLSVLQSSTLPAKTANTQISSGRLFQMVLA